MPTSPSTDANGEVGPPGVAMAAGNAEGGAGDADSPGGPKAIEAEPEAQLRRALADLDNLRKRYERELARERAAERARVASEWLPVVDNLERALQHSGTDGTALVAGVQAVLDQALAALARLGFRRFDDVGEPFDPARHDAVGTVEDAAPPGTVVAAVRPGYGAPEAVLRPAGVVVSKGAADG